MPTMASMRRGLEVIFIPMLLYQLFRSFENGVADFAFKTLFGHGYACCASDFLLGLRKTNGTLPRECETRDFHFGDFESI